MLLSALSFGAISNAYASFTEEGKVSKLTRSYIFVNDTKLQLSPTVKVFLKDGKRGNLRDIRSSDYVRTHVISIDNRNLVDSIRVLSEEPSNEE